MNKDALITQLALIIGFFMLWGTHVGEQYQLINHQQDAIQLNQARILTKQNEILISMLRNFEEGLKDANLFHRDLQRHFDH